MYRAEYEGVLHTPESFRQHAGADYHARKIFPHCPDCSADVTLRGDVLLPHDPASLFPDAARTVTAHFSHLPGQGNPECRYITTNVDPRLTAFASHLEKDESEFMRARRQFVTEDGRVTQAGYWAGFTMARILGRDRLREDFQFFDNAQRMLTLELIPPLSDKQWRRRAPGWTRPFTWLLFHDFPMKGRGDNSYEIQFRLDLPEGSILDAKGRWHGEPAAITKVFKDSGRPLTDISGQPACYVVTEENAYRLAQEAAHWGNNRPFSHIALEKLHAHTLFPNIAPKG